MMQLAGARGGRRLQTEESEAGGVVPGDPAQAGGDRADAGEFRVAQQADREVPQRRERLRGAAGADLRRSSAKLLSRAQWLRSARDLEHIRRCSRAERIWRPCSST